MAKKKKLTIKQRKADIYICDGDKVLFCYILKSESVNVSCRIAGHEIKHVYKKKQNSGQTYIDNILMYENVNDKDNVINKGTLDKNEFGFDCSEYHIKEKYTVKITKSIVEMDIGMVSRIDKDVMCITSYNDYTHKKEDILDEFPCLKKGAGDYDDFIWKLIDNGDSYEYGCNKIAITRTRKKRKTYIYFECPKCHTVISATKGSAGYNKKSRTCIDCKVQMIQKPKNKMKLYQK